MNKVLITAGGVLAVLVGFALHALVAQPAQQQAQSQQQYGSITGPDVYVPLLLHAGTIRDSYLATSTPSTSYTLVGRDFISRDGTPYDWVSVTPTVGALTLTFPASSTIPNFLPRAGNNASQCWYNASTTAGITVTFAAGTGIDLDSATNTLSILPDTSVCFKYFRKPATASTFDLGVYMDRYNQ